MVVWRSKLLLWYILLGTLIYGVIMVTEFLLQPFVVHHGVDPATGVDTGFAYSGMLMSPVAGMVVGSLLAAWVASRFGERRSLLIPLFVGALILLAPTLWDSLWVVAAIGLLAVIRGMIRPIATGYINRRIPSDQRATVLSIFSLVTAIMITIVIGTASALVDAYDFQAGYTLAFVLLVIGGAICWTRWRRAHNDNATS